MMRKVLSNQPSHQSQTQRENIIQIRCKVLNNTYSLVVDNGSCCNCYSTRLVENLAPHPEPYKLQWLNEGGALNVTNEGR